MAGTPNPFDEPGIWLRCALHAHTTNSDGDMPPGPPGRPLRPRRLRRAGDHRPLGAHRRACQRGPARPPGAELNALAGGPAEDVHVLALGIERDPELPSEQFAGLEQTVAWMLANGGVPYIAHTYWSGLRTEQFESFEGLVGLEVWNAGCELELGRGDSGLHWDEVLERGRRSTGSRPTTPTTRASTAPLPGRGCAPPSGRRRPCSTRSAPAPSTARPAPRSTARAGREPRRRPLQPRRERDLFSGRRRGGRLNAGRLGYPHEGRVLAPQRRRPDDRGRVPAIPTGALRTRRGRRRRRPPRLDEPAVDLSGRAEALTALGERRFDLLVIGGGIVGAGIAARGGGHGLAVALVDRGDFGGATSSSSSKLIHGGLRYLRLGDVRPRARGARGAAAPDERRRAPPRPPDPVPAARSTSTARTGRYVVQTGIAIYSTLARARLNGLVDAGARAADGARPARRGAAEVRPLRRLLDERQPSDPRERPGGRRVAERPSPTTPRSSRCGSSGGVSPAPRSGRRRRRSSVRARTVVNASRPLARPVRRLEDPAAAPLDPAQQGGARAARARPRAGRRR